MHTDSNAIFDEVREYPDGDATERYQALVGLDTIKTRLEKEATILLDPQSVENWSHLHHKRQLPLATMFRDRPPLFIFGGDVGTGKTALAETFCDPIARSTGLPVTLYELSLNARGNGAVGQMTTLLTAALGKVRDDARRAAGSNGRPRSAVVLLVDEADALAQSRESSQMHHEDRAGVNALIRGVDDLANGRLPAIVVLCTNRLDAIDPAVRRRAAATFQFTRPNDQQRLHVLRKGLEGVDITEQQLNELVQATGARNGQHYGYTYSDLTQRLLPAMLLAAYPDEPVTFELAVRVVAETEPTPPFQEHSNAP